MLAELIEFVVEFGKSFADVIMDTLQRGADDLGSLAERLATLLGDHLCHGSDCFFSMGFRSLIEFCDRAVECLFVDQFDLAGQFFGGGERMWRSRWYRGRFTGGCNHSCEGDEHRRQQDNDKNFHVLNLNGGCDVHGDY